MNPTCIVRLSFAAAGLILVAAAATAQMAPPSPSAPTAAAVNADTDAPIILSPFTTSASSDVGFVATTSLAGGRLNSSLKDTAAAYSVLTSEFISALNLPDLESAVRWTVNSNLTTDNGSNAIFANQVSGQNGAGYLVTFRGIQGGQQQIDFFPAFYDVDSYDIDRYDFARGPNAILFGNGSMGGTPEASMKQAVLDHRIDQARVTIGSWDNVRFTADVNQPIGEQFAARVNLMSQDQDTWRQREFQRKLAGAFALNYSPFPNTQIRANGDIGGDRNNFGYAYVGDQVGGWDGKTTFSGPLTALPANAAAVGIARNGSSTSAYPVFIPGEASLGLVNWANSAATVGADNSAGVTPVGGTILPGAGPGYAGGPIQNAYSEPSSAFANAVAGSKFRFPSRQFTTTLDAPTVVENYDFYTLQVNQRVGDHLFLNAAGNYSSDKLKTDYTAVRGIVNAYIDINQNLPTGAPNPEFLEPYSESVRYLNITNFVAHNDRVNAALVYDHTRFGSFQLNSEAGYQEFSTPRAQYTYVIQDPTIDPRLWPSSKLIRYRYYWDTASRPEPNLGTITYTDPVNGTSAAVPTGFVLDDTRPGNTSLTEARFKYAFLVGRAQLFDDKLDLLVSGRRDGFNEVTHSSLAYAGYGYGPGWNGETIVYKPVGPANYFTLPTSRPTLSTGFPNLAAPFPAYQSDYSTPYVKGYTNSYDIGAVYHLANWVEAFADKSSTYNPPTPAARINGGVFGPLLSKGWDAGFRFTFLSDKLVLTLTQYAAQQTNVALPTGTQSLPFAIPGVLNNIINLTPLNDLNPADINKEGLAPVPAVYSDTATAQAKGREIELTANPLPGWRVLANAAFPVATQSNAFADSRAYIAANSATFQKILADGGVVINNGVATVDTSKPSSSFASVPSATAAATAYNQLQTLNANFVTGAQKVLRLPDYTANLYTDYTIQSGPLRDVLIGVGANYYGKEVIGFHGADTIVNPANAAATLPDPNASPYNPVYRGGYNVFMATLGYTWRYHRHSVHFDLYVNNLLGNDHPIYYNTAQQPPNGNLSTPARVATPYLYYYLTPRNYAISATLQY